MKNLILAALLTAAIPCAAQVNIQGSNIQVGGSGGSGSVIPAPQGLIYAQVLSGTQAVANPASKTVNTVAPLLQGVGNTELFSTGNNGIATFYASYPTGFASVPPYSTSTENNAIPPSGAALLDYRGNGRYFVGHNGLIVKNCNPYGANTAAQCEAFWHDASTSSGVFHQGYYNTSGPGFSLGDTGLPYANGWSVRQHHYDDADLLTRGIKQQNAFNTNCIGTGDCGLDYGYGATKSATKAPGDEGSVALYRSMIEIGTYYHGTVQTTAHGSNNLSLVFSSGYRRVGDGSFLLDITKGTYTGTSSGLTFPAVISGGAQFMAVNLTSGTVPVSTAWGISQAGTGSAATGKYQVSVPQTLTFKLGDASPGSFSNGPACIIGKYDGGVSSWSEQTPLSSVGAASAGNQTLTFTTRYAYQAGALLMQGGMCGQYATPQSAAGWRTPMLSIGSLSSTQIVLAACTHGSCTANGNQIPSSDLYFQTLYNVDHNIAWYPGAEIIGTNGDTLDTAQLEPNAVAWDSGDAVENPNDASINVTGAHIIAGQTTATNDGESSSLLVDWNGPASSNYVARVRLNGGSTTDMLRLDFGTRAFHNAIEFTGTQMPGQTFFDMQGMAPLAGHGFVLWIGPSNRSYPIFQFDATGHFLFTKANGDYWSIGAANIPPVPTATAQIPISVSTHDGDGGFASDYANVAMSGDATMATTGVLTLKNSGVAAGSYTCTNATFDINGRATAASNGSCSGNATHQLSAGYQTPGAGITAGYFGPVFFEPYGATLKGVQAQIIDSGACTAAPVMQLMDLGTSPTTAYGSATSIQSLTTGTTNGVYATGAVTVAMTSGHYYSYAYSAGTCSDIVFNQATATITN